jgi:histidyl-tRNA synthetase
MPSSKNTQRNKYSSKRMAKPGIPQGTRDFSAETVWKRQYILQTIRTVFETYGYQPLETPAMENLDTLMGKYGEEGDKLIFKILNNGLGDPAKAEKSRAAFEKVLEGKNTADLTERALKYDLTIPFARFIAMNHGQLTFPYKRYQMQPVWRADRPQKGRYREFTQCDADVAGSKSLLNEVELALIYDTVFRKLGLTGYELRINSRKILAALAQACGGAGQLTAITVAIDKLDKIGIEKVLEELEQKSITAEQRRLIQEYLSISGNNTERLEALRKLLPLAEAEAGIADLAFVLKHTAPANIVVDFTLARGLNYYTGLIFEAKAPETVKMGSIGGGGRYDDLTGLFGVPNISGVGISFGIDRIYDVLEELNLFPESIQTSVQALFFHMGETESLAAFEQMQQLRTAGIACELYHEAGKLDKQFKYAERKKIPFVIIIGSAEITEAAAVVKNLGTGEQQKIPFKSLKSFFQP